jgi:calcineurin-like phosphoesterase family protein
MSLFLSSDHHFGHAAILKYREGYSSLEEMNEDLVARWNDTVSPEDTVYYLGDLVMGQRADTLQWVSRLNGLIYLVPGNHDHVHPMHMDRRNKEWRDKWSQMYLDAGIEAILPPEVSFTWGDTEIKLCHFPYEGDHTEEERYEEWRPKRGNTDFLLHGHVHSLWKANGDQINVGVDVHDFRPVRIEDLLTL